jgi:transcriptional regulator GlxA family with amidase domain
MASTEALDTMIDYIARNYMDSIAIVDLEREAGMSRFAITRQFQQAFQISPMRWIWRFRVSKAAILLDGYPDLPCRDIAYICGFESPSHFCRLFRGILGVSPSHFRGKNQGDNQSNSSWPALGRKRNS